MNAEAVQAAGTVHRIVRGGVKVNPPNGRTPRRPRVVLSRAPWDRLHGARTRGAPAAAGASCSTAR
jgi:hypothetical protein